MPSDRGAAWLLFDGDCRICSAFARWIGFLDVRDGIRIQSIQQSRDLLQAVPAGDILDAVHAISADGRVATGPDALPLLFSALLDGPALERLLRSSPRAMAALSRFYDLLVGLRGHLSCAFDVASSAARTPR